jgi:hypothetical protein
VEIAADFFSNRGATSFADGKALGSFFRDTIGTDFPPWFSAKVANRAEWKDRAIKSEGLTRFQPAWDSFLAQRPASLLEVLAYTCIFINETGGTFIPKSEAFGRSGHPGIAYLFDGFDITDSSGHSFHKASYNTGAGGRTAGSLFSDPLFNQAHGAKALGKTLAGTTDPVWNGEAYPQGAFPTSGKPEETGYILEADFFKFRGRGLIQTTWREGYRKLVPFIQAYAGSQPTVLKYKALWAGKDPDEVCTISSNEDWDALFQNSDLAVPCASLLIHAKGGGYLPLSTDPAIANGEGKGSVVRMGLRISGSGDYGRLLRARMARIVEALPA